MVFAVSGFRPREESTNPMKTHYLLAAAAAAALLLGGCATDMAGTNASPDVSAARAAVAIDVYYDGFYGPVTHGYRGVDGSFYYQDASGAYQKDYGYHFFNSPSQGATKLHLTHG